MSWNGTAECAVTELLTVAVLCDMFL